MSSFNSPIVIIPKIEKHTNADALSIVTINTYPVIFKTGQFKEGDKAIFVSEETTLPNKPEYAWLWSGKENPTDNQRTIWAKRLRGIFSCGFLMPVPAQYKDYVVGTDMSVIMGFEKFEKPEPIILAGDNESSPEYFIIYTNIENLRKFPDTFNLMDNVIVTEKCHGSNWRGIYKDGKFTVGSHRNAKKNDNLNVFSKAAISVGIEQSFQKYPDILFFGEVYPTQKLTYGAKSPSIVFFDAWDTNNHKWIFYDDMVQMITSLGLTCAPLVYRGPWLGLEKHLEMADGPTLIGWGPHHREGIIVRGDKDVPEWNPQIGRTVGKLIGQTYLLNKGK